MACGSEGRAIVSTMFVVTAHVASCIVYACMPFLVLTSARVAPNIPPAGSPSFKAPYYGKYKLPEDFKRSLRSQGEITYSTVSSGIQGDSSPTATEVLEFIDQIQRGYNVCVEGKHVPNPMKHYKFPEKYFYKPFEKEIKKAVDLSNTLNNYFVYNETKYNLYNDVMYFALTQTVVSNDHNIIGCGIAFDTGQYLLRNSTQFFPYTYKIGKNSETVVSSDISTFYRYTDTTWFKSHKKKTKLRTHQKDFVFANESDVGTIDNYDFRKNYSVVLSAKQGFWGQPYFDCKLQRLVVQYSVPFYNSSGSVPVFKGAVLVDIDLGKLEINQCVDSESLFANTHRCRPETTRCVNIPGHGLSWASYQCQCSQGFYFPQEDAERKYFDGRSVEQRFLNMLRNISDNNTRSHQCLPCRKGCVECEQDAPCIVAYDILLRGIPLGIQSFCMTITLVIGIVIVRVRKTKVMRSSMWILLEMILLGALLLYATVVIQYFEPTTLTCLMVPWFREVGFAVVYGALVLKVYRILAEFQSRKAHRVHVRDKDLLKYLAVIFIVVVGYMAAWTAVNMDHLSEGTSSLVAVGKTEDNLNYYMCKSHWWDYVIEMSEILFLCFGVYLCYCVRSAPSDYSEGRFISASICYEALISAIFYILKHLWWSTLHPDYMFLVYFLRCQLTVTIVLLLILGPKVFSDYLTTEVAPPIIPLQNKYIHNDGATSVGKNGISLNQQLWYAHRPLDDDHIRNPAYAQSDVQDNISPETMKLNVGISSNGDVDVGEISLAEMDPEDIRAELKRLYTQLQIYKTKTMRKDNPHISKRRGGRKQTHRRFSLQAFHHKHRHHHDHSEHEHEMSKTPEESTNSAEAMAMTMDERSRGEESHEPRSGPSVSFKPGHK